MELEVRTTIPPEFEAQFSVKASEAGVAAYVQQLIIADLQKPRHHANTRHPCLLIRVTRKTNLTSIWLSPPARITSSPATKTCSTS